MLNEAEIEDWLIQHYNIEFVDSYNSIPFTHYMIENIKLILNNYKENIKKIYIYKPNESSPTFFKMNDRTLTTMYILTGNNRYKFNKN